MATVIGDICAATGKYMKGNEEKTSWMKCGVLLETDKGFRIKLDGIPVGGGEGQGIWFSVFPRDEGGRQGSGTQTRSRPSQGVDDQSDIPF
jgi:hypothetical protein